MINGFKNTKKQGDFGLGNAICYFTKKGYTVSLPLTDSQDYDLVVEIDGCLKKVQIKTTFYKTKDGVYNINLSVKGGNRSYNTIKKFDRSMVDYIFVSTGDGSNFFIPTEFVSATTSMNVGKQMERFKVL